MADHPDSSPVSDKRPNLAYEALTPLGGDRARVRFRGRFQDRPVVWDAEIMTLQAAWRQSSAAGRNARPPTLRQFIEIDDPGGEHVRLRIALAVAAIDAPTVFKSMIMVHNYKRLRAGRHEYGPAHEINQAT